MTTHSDRRDFLKQAALAGRCGSSATALGTWPRRAAAAGTVNWLAWGGHVEPEGLKRFFDTSGIRVNHIGMSGNAETFAKLKLSGTAQYDLFEADGLWPVRYQQEGMIEPIDLESIPNVAKNMHPEFKRIPALQASGGKMLIVPWGWNPTVLIYNKARSRRRRRRTRCCSTRSTRAASASATSTSSCGRSPRSCSATRSRSR